MTANLFSQFRYSDSLTVVGISVCTAVVCEAISWLLIYRTNSYKSLKSTIDKASKKLETMKTDPNAAPKISLKKSKTKKIDRVETSLKESSRDLSLFKFKSGAVVALVLFVVFGFLNNLFEGKAVAKLPFVPIRIVHKMGHRGLQKDDPTDCSMAFLYFLCLISIRTNLQKYFVLFVLSRGLSKLGFSQCLMPRPIDRSDVNIVCFADEIGHIIYSGSDDGLCKVWDRRCLVTTRQASEVLLGHLEGITFIDSRGDGRYLISNGKDQAIKLWDIRKMASNLSHNSINSSSPWDYRWMEYPDHLRNSSHPCHITS